MIKFFNRMTGSLNSRGCILHMTTDMQMAGLILWKQGWKQFAGCVYFVFVTIFQHIFRTVQTCLMPHTLDLMKLWSVLSICSHMQDVYPDHVMSVTVPSIVVHNGSNSAPGSPTMERSLRAQRTLSKQVCIS